jgi:hypothetical protein
VRAPLIRGPTGIVTRRRTSVYPEELSSFSVCSACPHCLRLQALQAGVFRGLSSGSML